MTMLVDYDKLWQDGGYGRDNKLDATIQYLLRLAAKQSIPQEVVELAIREVFLEVASGKKYPLDKCPCGCGIDASGTAITHAMRDRMLEVNRNRVIYLSSLYGARSNAAILAHITQDNAVYLAKNGPRPSRWTNWDESYIIRGIKWIGSRLSH